MRAEHHASASRVNSKVGAYGIGSGRDGLLAGPKADRVQGPEAGPESCHQLAFPYRLPAQHLPQLDQVAEPPLLLWSQLIEGRQLTTLRERDRAS
jgi:hypothetical protein